jgi:hypothetical protein
MYRFRVCVALTEAALPDAFFVCADVTLDCGMFTRDIKQIATAIEKTTP